jgi:molybdopterin converting factor small subunit
MANVFIPTALRPYTGRQSQVEAPGATVAEALAALVAAYPDLKNQVFDDQGEPRNFVNFFLGDTDIRQLSGLDTPLAPDADLLIVPAIAGGRETR